MLVFCLANPIAVLANSWANETPNATPDETPDETPVVALVLENDAFADADRHYTGGLRLGVATPLSGMAAARLAPFARLPLFDDRPRWHAAWTIGQSTFTPHRIDRADPEDDDRPYAGWLYVSGALIGEGENRSDSLELALGIAGPSSGADRLQRELHAAIGAQEPLGWDRQLEDRSTIDVVYQRRLASLRRSRGRIDTVVAPHAGIAFGNMLSYANGGLTIRTGPFAGRDAGPTRVRPGVPGSSLNGLPDGGWYGFASVELRRVFRNRFIEGYGGVRGERALPWVADLQLGVVWNLHGLKIGYTHVLRSDEFDAQRHRTLFGALSLAWHWR